MAAIPLLLLSLLGGGPLQGKAVPPTPNEEDIPKPVPGEVGLAGAERPDIARFLNVRTAGAPSLSPDGKRLSFRTGITGHSQVWIVDALPKGPTGKILKREIRIPSGAPRG